MNVYLTENDVLALLPMTRAIELVEDAFRQMTAGTAINHPRRRVVLPTGSVLHYMAAGMPPYFGIKVYSTNPKTGAHFQVLLFRSEEGLPLATIEANHLGQIRTGAATGAATKHLAREGASVLGVIGSGFQAETQIEAIANVRKLREIRVWSRSAEKREAFSRRCSDKFELNVKGASSAQACVDGADIVVTATSAREPVLEAAWISPGAHVNAAGSNWANRRELPGDLIFERASLVAVDSLEVASLESGDILIPMREMSLSSSPAVEIGDIIAGRIPGRTRPDQITIFKSNGLAVEDIAVAGFIYEAALRSG